MSIKFTLDHIFSGVPDTMIGKHVMSKKSLRTEDHHLFRFFRDNKANVGIIFGIVLIPLMIAMGSAVDYSRAFLKQKNLATAVDAAVLAGGVFSEASQTVFEDKVRKTLYANFPEGEISNLEFSLQPETQEVKVTAQSNVETVFAGIWNVHNIPITATATAAPTRQWAEIALVLDNTGSMRYSGKMAALKIAAKQLVNTLHDTAADSSKLFIGIVPFSGTVRLGTDYLNSPIIDQTGQSSISGEDFSPGTTNVLDLYDAMEEYTWNGCIRARPSGYDLLDTEADNGSPETLFPPYFAPDESSGVFLNSYINDPNSQTNVTKYTTVAPNTSDPTQGPEFNCPPQPILELTNTRQDVIDTIDGMVPQGSTAIPIGLVWGWRMVTPNAPYEAREFATGNKKFIILLTDGKNDVGGHYGNLLAPNQSFYNAYGFASEGHLGNTSGSQAETFLNSKTTTLCTNAKAQGIKIFTITFQLPDGPTKDLFKACATTPAMHYDSPDNATLNETFESIASELQKLRLTK